MKNTIRIFALAVFTIWLTSCISIGGSNNVVPAKNLVFMAPESPFLPYKAKTGDKSWQSSKTKNAISFISDCSQESDPSLLQLEKEVLAGFDQVEVLTTETILYNQRSALVTLVAANLDGVPIKANVVSFKKNGCNYNLIYGGKSSNFDQEISIFRDFVKEFRAP